MKLMLLLQRLSTLRLWLLSIGISVLMSELIVCGMEMLLRGEITYDYLLTGFVTSLCVAAIIVAGLSYFIDQHKQAAQALGIWVKSVVNAGGVFPLPPLAVASHNRLTCSNPVLVKALDIQT